MNPLTTVVSPLSPAPAEAATEADMAAVLADASALWDTLWRTSGEYVVVIDRAGIIRSCNRVEEGFTLDDIVGHSIVRFTVPESSVALAEMLDQVFTDGEMRTLETTVRRLDGGLSYFALRIAPLRRDGRIVAALGCCENIRPLKDSERALVHERNVLRRLLEIQERERQLVSYEIHDGLAQYLAGALMHFQAYSHDQGTRTGPRDFDDGMRLLQTAVLEARRLIGGLRPPALDELGIVDAIDTIIAEARADIPEITFVHDLPGDRLPPQVETILFRIVQETLTNARKHAAARSASVTLELLDGHVRVRVHDDGRGFDPAAVPEERFGLEGIRQRCRLLGGEPRITSAPGAGTTIEVTLPIPAAG